MRFKRHMVWRCHINYRGEIDTHGFSILDQLRGVMPHAESFLMDRTTFETLRHLCCDEPKPSRRGMPRLTEEKLAVFRALLDPDSGGTRRLEQRKIPLALRQLTAQVP